MEGLHPRFPVEDIARSHNGQSYYQAAAVCRRGHIETRYLDPGRPYPADSKCPTCGALVLVACGSCGLRIRGDYFAPGVIGFDPSPRPSFCDGCGAAHPWATREERIYELENILDEEDMDEADRVFIHDRLRELREGEVLDEKRERQLWVQIRDRSGKFISSEPVKKIAETVVSAAIRNQLGI
ncbi:DUF2321 domain-containing protein [Micromonospora sp. NPDC049836]|uniref:DUF2321 domain-containing protein n=1 Tax=Micromonospora sp. NPDC049836 TaxID=3364274 RepID=UPI0037B95384